MMGQDNVFDPSEPYGAYKYYMQPSVRSEFSIEEPAYLHRPVFKDEDSRSSDYTSGDSFRRGSTCRVLLCVFLIFCFIAVVVAAITLAVLSQYLLFYDLYNQPVNLQLLFIMQKSYACIRMICLERHFETDPAAGSQFNLIIFESF